MDQEVFEDFLGKYMNKNCEKEYTQHVFRSFDFNNDGQNQFKILNQLNKFITIKFTLDL